MAGEQESSAPSNSALESKAEERGQLIAGAQKILQQDGEIETAKLQEAERMLDTAEQLRNEIGAEQRALHTANLSARATEMWEGAELPAPEAGSTVPAVVPQAAPVVGYQHDPNVAYAPATSHPTPYAGGVLGGSIRSMADTASRTGYGAITLSLANVATERQLLSLGVEPRDLTQAARFGVEPQTLATQAVGEQARALNIGTDNKGGYTVPTITERTFYDYLEQYGGVRKAGPEVWTTEHGRPIELTTVASHFTPSSTLETAEAAAIADTEPTLGQVTLGAHKYTGSITYTRELMMDTAINLDDLVTGQLARTVATKTEMRFTNGTGSSMPKGIMHSPASGNTTTTAGSNALATDDFLNAYYAMDGDLLMEGRIGWMMNSKIYGKIIALKDSDGRPLFQPSYMTGAPEMLLGKPVFWNAQCAGGLADNDIAIAVGNFRRNYIIRQDARVVLESSIHAEFRKQMIVFQASCRMDGQIRDTRAMHYIKIKA